MRSIITLSTFLLSTQAQLIPFLTNSKPNQPHHQAQAPPSTDSNLQYPMSPTTNSAVLLTDILGSHRQITTFTSLCNSLSSVQTRLDSASQNSTLLAPSNSAMSSLPRKPWEDPEDYNALGEKAYSGGDGEERAQKNLEKFVQAHVVPQSPWGEGEKVKTLAGGEVWWEEKDGRRMVMPQGVEVEGVVGKVGNGEVWVLKGVLGK